MKKTQTKPKQTGLRNLRDIPIRVSLFPSARGKNNKNHVSLPKNLRVFSQIIYLCISIVLSLTPPGPFFVTKKHKIYLC